MIAINITSTHTKNVLQINTSANMLNEMCTCKFLSFVVIGEAEVYVADTVDGLAYWLEKGYRVYVVADSSEEIDQMYQEALKG